MAYLVLSELGSIASIVGLPLAIAALVFAIYHLMNLRGEARAAREAAEEAVGLFRRDLTNTDLARLSERIQNLVELQRNGDRIRALERYPEIRGLLHGIRRQHPNLSADQRRKVQNTMALLGRMQGELESLEGDLPPELAGRLNKRLLQLQNTLLVELEDHLESN